MNAGLELLYGQIIENSRSAIPYASVIGRRIESLSPAAGIGRHVDGAACVFERKNLDRVSMLFFVGHFQRWINFF